MLLFLRLHHTPLRNFWKWSSPGLKTSVWHGNTLYVVVCRILSGLGPFAFILNCRLSGVGSQRKFNFELKRFRSRNVFSLGGYGFPVR